MSISVIRTLLNLTCAGNYDVARERSGPQFLNMHRALYLFPVFNGIITARISQDRSLGSILRALLNFMWVEPRRGYAG